jgi:hypothetical protein
MLWSAASRHPKGSVFYATVEKCSDYLLCGPADMGNNADAGRRESGLLSQRNHPANQEVHAQFRQKFGSLKRISHGEKLLAASLFLPV